MKNLKRHILCLMVTAALVAVLSLACLGASAGLDKSVQVMADGNYLVKLTLTARSSGVYTLKLSDPKAAIIDVYAPKGWCIITDGGDLIARTFGNPVLAGKSVEFIIHATSDEIHYTWSVFGKINQLGKAETL